MFTTFGGAYSSKAQTTSIVWGLSGCCGRPPDFPTHVLFNSRLMKAVFTGWFVCDIAMEHPNVSVFILAALQSLIFLLPVIFVSVAAMSCIHGLLATQRSTRLGAAYWAIVLLLWCAIAISSAFLPGLKQTGRKPLAVRLAVNRV